MLERITSAIEQKKQALEQWKNRLQQLQIAIAEANHQIAAHAGAIEALQEVIEEIRASEIEEK